ncbi:MAG: glutathione S-transferase family protein [Gammaproteobacteria bacterium]|nr:glutathione S-transferase family protein [Gammaproteobacteria bacterium]
MKLYHHPVSNNCRRVLVAAELLDTELETEQVDLMSGKNRDPAFLALNPNGKVPTLVDGDTRLWESNAIIQYLADRRGETELYPRDPARRADIARWQFWASAHLAPPVDTLAFERTLKSALGMGEPDEVAIARATDGVERFLPVLNESLEGRDYLAGEALTLADVSLIATLSYADAAQLRLENYPNINAWRDRLEASDAFKAHQVGL